MNLTFQTENFLESRNDGDLIKIAYIIIMALYSGGIERFSTPSNF